MAYVPSRSNSSPLGHQWQRFFSQSQLPFSVNFNILKYHNAQQTITSPTSRHAILVFIVPILIDFIEVKYQGNSNKTSTPFETHPKSTMLAITSLLMYSLGYGFELTFSSQHPPPHYSRVLRGLMTWFGSLSLASLASILFPDSLQVAIYCFYILLSIREFYGVVLTLCQWIHQGIANKILSASQAWQRRVRPTNSVLPLTVTEIPTNYNVHARNI